MDLKTRIKLLTDMNRALARVHLCAGKLAEAVSTPLQAEGNLIELLRLEKLAREAIDAAHAFKREENSTIVARLND